MKDTHRSARQLEIEEAAYELLAERGYTGTSMLSIAKRAKCSNETLYNWYGDKLGLMRAMVERNAAGARKLLGKALREERSPLETLDAFGPALLKILLDEKPIALNRAAAADPTGELGSALSAAGRETIFPLLQEVFERAGEKKQLCFEDVASAVETYLGLLIGDLQVRRIIGRVPPLSDQDIGKRSKTALQSLTRLLS